MSRLFATIAIFFILSSCRWDDMTTFDRYNGTTKKDIKYSLVRDRKQEKKDVALQKEDFQADIPRLSKMISSPPPPKIGSDKLISFSVTDSVPLKDVLIEIGRVASIDIDIDPTIGGGIIINAIDRPLKEVIDRIAFLGDLRYSYNKGVLYFERDVPYLKNYFVDYLVDGSLWSDVESNIGAILLAKRAKNEDNEKNQANFASSFTSNKSAGIISVFATLKQHELLEKYLAAVEKTASAQVLIEAKVVEVTLNDQYKTGINWAWVGGRQFEQTTEGGDNTTTTTIVNRRNFKLNGGFDSVSSAATSVFTGLLGGNLDLSVSALEKFGTTKTLSSPRIHAMNNHLASLNFADKLIYFEIDSSQTSSTANNNTNIIETFSSEVKEEDVGVQLEITPSINLKNREIVMKIKPTLSIKSGEVVDPASPTNSDGVAIFENKVPVIQSRELETVAKIESGNVIVIGGLMKEEETNVDSGIPYLQNIPLLGWLFKSTSKEKSVTETVIFIKATIVESSDSLSDVDKSFQDMYDSNKRKFVE